MLITVDYAVLVQARFRQGEFLDLDRSVCR